jgi:hypothetical protein
VEFSFPESSLTNAITSSSSINLLNGASETTKTKESVPLVETSVAAVASTTTYPHEGRLRQIFINATYKVIRDNLLTLLQSG